MQDQLLLCCDCQTPFIFTVTEQAFFLEHNLANVPKRCHNCRVIVRVRRKGGDLAQITAVPCCDCGRETRVPFRPKGHKPVLCAMCLHLNKPDLADVPLPTCS